ncbi:hypothetical protein [Campylobacter jejuni]|uniref:hypothetical protein n=1 Tax=Campylobacter jejuni TaxID=197 RepID=UPI00073DB7A8|nr:hypothetical protein [Campylobacter jejuni]ALW15631.1 hypothetical protein RC26_02760 [Campylobacter jejuni]
MKVLNNIKVLELAKLEDSGKIEIVSKNKIRSTGKYIFTYKAKKDIKQNGLYLNQGEHFQREF